jgi:manganese/zinc/iron transport system permease protein
MQVAGFKPLLIYYALMTLVSLTTVGAFDIVGSIVVVAMTITPAATALLWVRRMPYVLYAAVGISCITAFMGYCFAVVCDVSIAGSMALANGVLFVCVLLSGKKGGID